MNNEIIVYTDGKAYKIPKADLEPYVMQEEESEGEPFELDPSLLRPDAKLEVQLGTKYPITRVDRQLVISAETRVDRIQNGTGS